MGSAILDIKAREILDSRGHPTVEVEVVTDDEFIGLASVPSGASTGKHEAVELRDQDMLRYNGKGVLKAVQFVNDQIRNELQDLDVTEQLTIDQILRDLDGTANKAKMGANAILGVSLAVAKAAAASLGIPLYRYVGGFGVHTLPVPFMNVLNGGAHADNSVDIQEFMIVPTGAKRFSEALRMGVEVFYALKSILKKQGYTTNIGDEGGFAPNLKSNVEAIEILLQAIEKAGYQAGKDIFLALDAAASSFYDESSRSYVFHKSDNSRKSTDDLITFWQDWCDKYPILSIEDGLAEEDWAGWQALTQTLGSRIQLVGDDLFVTNPRMIAKGLELKAANAVLIKINQIGTLSETCEAVELSHRHGWRTMVSHRSGETEDTSIADLSVAFNSGQIKTGSLARTDRVAKYNQLLRIEEELGPVAAYAGTTMFEQPNHKP